MVDVADTEEEGGGQERVREHPALTPTPVLRVGGVVVEQLALGQSVLLWRPQAEVSPAQAGDLISVEITQALPAGPWHGGIVASEWRTEISVVLSEPSNPAVWGDCLL